MSDLIGEARVRVRPDTRGFQSETQSAIKAPLVSIGKFITGALAIKGGFDLGKELLSDAARVQKSSEVIRAEFGKSGNAIIEFADTAGLKLGLAAHVTEDTAARFGILFKNIGIGKKPAAEMTLNLEKLAGSIAAIRGKDPAQILGTLPLALSGSLRGLRQLGFAFTPVQVKEEALRLGLIKTMKQALDPGARAIAIYGLVTKNLGDYQDQAAKHASDAYNIQKRLSAEWDHAKEVLGTGVLPEIAKYGTELSDFIDKGEKSGQIQKDINAVAHDGKVVIKDIAGAVKLANDAYGTFAGLVGGKDNAIKILADAFLLLYARSKLIKWGIIETGIETTGEKAVIANKRVGALAGSLARLKNLGPIAVVIGLSFVKKNTKGQDVLDKEGLGFLGKLPFIGNTEQQLAEAGHKVGNAILQGVADVLGAHGSKKGLTPAQIIAKAAREGKFDLTTGLPFPPQAKKAGGDIGAGISKSIAAGIQKKTIAAATADAALTALKAAATVANNEAAQQLADARYQVQQAKETLAQAKIDAKQAVADSIKQAKQNLSSLAASIAGDASKQGSLIGPSASIDLKRLVAQLSAKDAAGAGRSSGALQSQLQSGSGSGPTLDRKLADLADLFNRGSIGAKRADLRLDQILKSAGVNASVIQRGQGVAAADQFRADVAAFKAQINAQVAGPRAKGTGLEATIVKPLEVLRQQNRIIAQDAHQVESAQLGVQRELLNESKRQTAERKREAALLAKIEAKLPSKHDSAQLQAYLRQQNRNDPKAAADARASARRGH